MKEAWERRVGLTYNIANNSLTLLQGKKFDTVFITDNHIRCSFSNNRKFNAKSLSLQNKYFNFLVAGSAIVQSQLLDVQPSAGGLRICGVCTFLVCELVQVVQKVVENSSELRGVSLLWRKGWNRVDIRQAQSYKHYQELSARVWPQLSQYRFLARVYVSRPSFQAASYGWRGYLSLHRKELWGTAICLLL